VIPRNDGVELTETIQIRRMPSLTDRLDLEKGKIQGTADGREAMKQAIYKILHTKRYAHEIYDWDYGMEWEDLWGRPKSFTMPELKKRIEEALLADDRVDAVTDFRFFSKKNSLTVSFRVQTIFGEVGAERTVDI